jgi:hypothetical protein
MGGGEGHLDAEDAAGLLWYFSAALGKWFDSVVRVISVNHLRGGNKVDMNEQLSPSPTYRWL